MWGGVRPKLFDRRDGTRSGGRTDGIKGRILPEDALVEPLQGKPGIDAELLGQGPPSTVEGDQRISLPTRPILSQHQLGPEALPEREPNDQRLQLADDRGVVADLQVALEPLLQRAQTQLLEPSDLCLSERYVGQVLERGSPEQREGSAEDPSRGPVIRGCKSRPRPIEQDLEALQIELAVLNPQQVSGCPGYEARSESVSAEELPQAGDGRIEGRTRAARRRIPPHPFDEAVPRYPRVPVEQQYRQRRPLLLPAEREDPIRLEDLQRAENPKLQLTLPCPRLDAAT